MNPRVIRCGIVGVIPRVFWIEPVMANTTVDTEFFTRWMRDEGYDFFHYDQHCTGISLELASQLYG